MIKLQKMYGLWTVVTDEGRVVQVRCRCGKTARVFRYNLTRGFSRGCASCSNRRTKPRALRRRYGRWRVIRATAERDASGGIVVAVRCSCGKEAKVRAAELRRGKSRGCKACAARRR